MHISLQVSKPLLTLPTESQYNVLNVDGFLQKIKIERVPKKCKMFSLMLNACLLNAAKPSNINKFIESLSGKEH